MLDPLSSLATGRTTDLFQNDLNTRHDEIAEKINAKRILVIGGAGSIGSSTVHALLNFQPHALHIVDQNENNLAELVRDIRSSRDELNVADFRLLPLDFGSEVMRRFLAESASYDYVMNFAAIKHVRSEKDIYSVLQMLNTNVLKPARLLQWLLDYGHANRYFSVSTDKAANPVNLMGASKHLMEHVMFSDDLAPNASISASSARFANVAFSEGSLLQSFQKRLEKQQALAAPRDTKRFFISLREAGQICLLASVCGDNKHLLIPRLEPDEDLHDLEEIAVRFLRHHKLEPRKYDDENSARHNVQSDLADGRYPLLLTPLDTSGEKPFEEFVGDNESSVEINMENLLAVPYRPAPSGTVAELLNTLGKYLTNLDIHLQKEDIVSAISEVIPYFKHIESEKSLDDRM